MKLAIVTACPNGMVTSVLCARLLDAAAQRMGLHTSVEVVDVQRPERQLSQATIESPTAHREAETAKAHRG